MCYYPVSVQWGKWIEQPTPEQVTKIIDTILENHIGDVNILFTSKMPNIRWDCLNISIYNPDEEMCMLFEKIVHFLEDISRRSKQRFHISFTSGSTLPNFYDSMPASQQGHLKQEI